MADKKISALTAASTPLAGTEVLPIVQSGSTVKVAVSDLTAGRSISVSGLTNSGVTASSMAFFNASNVLSGNATLTWNSGTQQLGFQNAAASAYGYIGTTGAGSNADFSVYMGATETVRFTNAGNIAIQVSGQGIDFSATSGSGTSELLSDYEEGTWTPSQGAGLTVVGSFGSSGTYTKIGRQVTIIGTITGSTSIACASGNVFVGNFPFNVGTYGAGSAFNAALNASTVLGSDGGSNMYSTTVIGATTRISFAFTYFV